MSTVLINFQSELLELREHLSYIQNIPKEIPATSPLFYYINSVTKKKFNYKSLIISLYGLVENFAEKFIIEYLQNLSAIIAEYPNLKNKIKDNNLFNSANLALKVIDQKNAKYNHIKEADIISNLHSCLTNSPNYQMNLESFTILAGNLKHSKMCELFKQIDIDLNAGFIKHTDFNLSSSENQFKKLDELVELRNEVAHGGLNSLLDSSEVEEYVDFIDRYFTNLQKLLSIDLEQEKLNYWVKFNAVELEDATVFKGNIIGFTNSKNISGTNQSLVIIVRKDKSFTTATIDEIRTYDNKDVTLKLRSSIEIKANQRFFIKS